MAFFFYVSFYFIFLDIRKNLGNLERFMCEVCDKFIPCLSQWLVHVRLEHLTRGQIKQSRRLKCFCCSWEPPRSQYQGGKKLHQLNIFQFSKAVQQYCILYSTTVPYIVQLFPWGNCRFGAAFFSSFFPVIFFKFFWHLIFCLSLK